MQSTTANEIMQDYVYLREIDETNHTIYTQQRVKEAENTKFIRYDAVQSLFEKIEKLKMNRVYVLRAQQDRFNAHLSDIKDKLVQMRHAYTVDDEQTQYEALLEHIDSLVE